MVKTERAIKTIKLLEGYKMALDLQLDLSMIDNRAQLISRINKTIAELENE